MCIWHLLYNIYNSPYMSLYNHSVRGWYMPCLLQHGLSKTTKISYYGHPIPKSGSICLLTVTWFQINRRRGTCLAVPQHSKSDQIRIFCKGNPCLCQEYFPMHSSHSSCHSLKHGKCAVSQAVKEWNNGNANDFDRPSCWCGIIMYRNVSIAFATKKSNP